MSEFFSQLEWGPVALALVPLVLAIAVHVAERLGWCESGSPEGASRCRCHDGPST